MQKGGKRDEKWVELSETVLNQVYDRFIWTVAIAVNFVKIH